MSKRSRRRARRSHHLCHISSSRPTTLPALAYCFEEVFVEQGVPEELVEEVVADVVGGVLPAVAVIHRQAGDLARGTLRDAPWHGPELAIDVVFVVEPPAAGDGPPGLYLAVIPASDRQRGAQFSHRRRAGLH